MTKISFGMMVLPSLLFKIFTELIDINIIYIQEEALSIIKVEKSFFTQGRRHWYQSKKGPLIIWKQMKVLQTDLEMAGLRLSIITSGKTKKI